MLLCQCSNPLFTLVIGGRLKTTTGINRGFCIGSNLWKTVNRDLSSLLVIAMGS